jgi:acyl-CoA reductase-like NAD-dependent aldehyde dehydrogenase
MTGSRGKAMSEGVSQLIRPFIDGELVESSSSALIANINPANGRVIGEVVEGSTEDIERAVVSARRVFMRGDWSAVAPYARKAILLRIGALIEERAEEFASLDMLEMGMPISNARHQASIAAGMFRYCAEAIEMTRDHIFSNDAFSMSMNVREPLGVVGAIIPWNYPLILAASKIAPALAAGNSVVVKPSELAPSSAVRLAGLLVEAGLPPGVVNVTPGLGMTAGQALALNMDVDKLTFTGSTATGGKLMEFAGRSNMKRLALECGGKSPVIVFPDVADMDLAAECIVQGFCQNQGQLCVAGTRLLIHRTIAEGLLQRIVKIVKSIVVNEPHLEHCVFGPLASRAQLEKVMSYVELGGQSGAVLLAGGRRVLKETGGFYFEPTIFAAVDPESDLAQDEIFGPVLATMTFETADEAVELANNTRFGLAARLWTSDFDLARKVAMRLKSGVVTANINGSGGAGAGLSASAEPRKMSGFGIEGGLEGVLAYTAQKSLSFNFK